MRVEKLLTENQISFQESSKLIKVLAKTEIMSMDETDQKLLMVEVQGKLQTINSELMQNGQGVYKHEELFLIMLMFYLEPSENAILLYQYVFSHLE